MTATRRKLKVVRKGDIAPKTSGNGSNGKDKPNKYEAFIRQDFVIEQLRTLSIGDKSLNGDTQDILPVTNRDLLYESADKKTAIKTITGAAHGLNQVFVAGRMPFYARSAGSRNIRIGRISRNFQEIQYATVWAHATSGKKDVTNYEEPKGGQRKRMADWKVKAGINFEADPVSESIALAEVSKIPEDVKKEDARIFDEFENSYLSRNTEEGEPIIRPDDGAVDETVTATAKKDETPTDEDSTEDDDEPEENENDSETTTEVK
jgi:hypothetical protein